MICDTFKFRGYQCFKKHWAGFERVLPINVVIGRNNTGKSQLMDLVESACRPTSKTEDCDFFASGKMDEKSLKKAFPENHHRSDMGGDLWHDHGRYLVGIKFEIEYRGNQQGVRSIKFLDSPNSLAQGIDGHLGRTVEARRELLNQAANDKKTILSGRIFRPLKADRDLKSEPGNNSLGLYPDGSGATNIVRRYLTSAKFSRDLVHVDLLNALAGC